MSVQPSRIKEKRAEQGSTAAGSCYRPQMLNLHEQIAVDQSKTIAVREGRLIQKDPVSGLFSAAQDYFALSIAEVVEVEIHGQKFYDFDGGWVSGRNTELNYVSQDIGEAVVQLALAQAKANFHPALRYSLAA